MKTNAIGINGDTFMFTDGIIRVNRFLLCGSRFALLIDTGYGEDKFLRAVKKCTPLPIIAANTHFHPDHSNGNRFFGRVYVGAADLPQNGVPSDALAKSVADFYREHTRIPDAVINRIERLGITQTGGEEYVPMPGEFDLGGRTVLTLPCPGHTPGSTLFLDTRDRAVYAGDAINPAFWAFTSPSLSLSSYADVWEGLKGKLCGFEKIYISHHKKPLDTGYVDAFIENLRTLRAADGKRSFIKGGTLEPVFIYERRNEKYGDMAVWAYPSQVEKI